MDQSYLGSSIIKAPVYLPAYPNTCGPACLPACPAACLSACLLTCLSVYLHASVCLPTPRLSVCLSVFLPACLCLLTFCQPTRLSVCLSTVYLPGLLQTSGGRREGCPDLSVMPAIYSTSIVDPLQNDKIFLVDSIYGLR